MSNKQEAFVRLGMSFLKEDYEYEKEDEFRWIHAAKYKFQPMNTYLVWLNGSSFVLILLKIRILEFSVELSGVQVIL